METSHDWKSNTKSIKNWVLLEGLGKQVGFQLWLKWGVCLCVADGERQIVGCFLLKFLSVYLDVCYVLYSALIRRVEALDISMFTIMLFPLSHYSNVSQIWQRALTARNFGVISLYRQTHGDKYSAVSVSCCAVRVQSTVVQCSVAMQCGVLLYSVVLCRGVEYVLCSVVQWMLLHSVLLWSGVEYILCSAVRCYLSQCSVMQWSGALCSAV